MQDFADHYMRIHRMATEAGTPSLQRAKHRQSKPQFTLNERKIFLRGCHRGFEIAQNSILSLLGRIEADATLNVSQKKYRSLLLRKLIDSMMFTVFRQELHSMRRLAIHSYLSAGAELPYLKCT